MKRVYFFVILSVLIMIAGCTNKGTGDKAIYGEVKSALMSKINNFNEEKKNEVLNDYGLDNKTLDELPLAIYNIDGRYVGVIESKKDDKKYFYYSVKKKKVVIKLDEKIGGLDLEHMTQIYSQNNFK